MNPITETIVFLTGVTMITFLAAGVFFLKFYRTSRDVFYLYFCLACWIFSLERIVILTIIGPGQTNSESAPWVYSIRLLGFLLIMIAIIKKNRSHNG